MNILSTVFAGESQGSSLSGRATWSWLRARTTRFWSMKNGWIVVSHDVNSMPGQAYARIADGSPVAGLLMAQQSDAIGEIIENLLLIWSASEAGEWEGQVVFLPLL